MKRKNKIILAVVIIFAIVISISYALFSILRNENRLSAEETEWLNKNKTTVQNISVLNDQNIFGTNGIGVFYDFLNDFKKKHDLQFNYISHNTNDNMSGIQLNVGNYLTDRNEVLYKDHFVLVTKTKATQIKNYGVLTENYDHVISNIPSLTENSIVKVTNRQELLEKFASGEINSIIVPRLEYLDEILKKDYYISEHYSDVIRYYFLGKENTKLSDILVKEMNSWIETDLNKSIKEHELNLFLKELGISKTEIDRVQSLTYRYGFVENSPYELLSGGTFGGITAEVLKEFADFSKTDFTFKKYNNYKKLVKGIENKEVDIYFNYQNFTNDYKAIDSNIDIDYVILYPENDSSVINSLNATKGTSMYVLDNSVLKTELQKVNSLDIKTYADEKELKKLIKNSNVIIMDSNTYQYYSHTELKKYSVRYENNVDITYSFRTNQDSVFVKIFEKYMNLTDMNILQNKGHYNHSITMKKGSILSGLAQYVLYLLAIVLVIMYMVYRSSKKVRLANKIKKENKMKFIDQLTSLKNRNYLNDNLENWNKNNVYPQATVVIDLNRLQEVNDTLGYEEGDRQIKSAANILVRTQLDNSDIIRTDGNEFLIYLVGYNMKTVTSYIHKLNKEFKTLPYEYGASIGYSMIESDLKNVEDAMNEALDDIKKQKDEKKLSEVNEKNIS